MSSNLPNPSMSFTPFDPLPASQLNDIVENVEALAGGDAFDSDAVIKIDSISEKTSAAGVTVDGLQIKDNTLVTVENVPIAVNRQDITTNNVYKDQLIQTGWGFKLGDGANRTLSDSVTFPVEYSILPVVTISNIGAKSSSDPTDIGDTSGAISGTWSFDITDITVTGFSYVLKRNSVDGADPGVLTNSSRYMFSWFAIGTKDR